MVDKVRFILFSIGLAVAAASSASSFLILYTSVLGQKSLVYESNSALALMEMVFLALAIGTCIVASEVYYRYLEIKKSVSVNKIESREHQ